MLNGVLNINKPEGKTSHDVVLEVRRLLKIKKVGHTGTLDPLATGVLPLCIGQATKLVFLLIGEDKEYQAKIILGITTETGNGEGRIIQQKPVSVIEPQIRESLNKFEGEIWQVPPLTSALRYQGRRLYELAREGKTVLLSPRKVKIYRLELLHYRLPEITIGVHCSRGTYIRSLARDIGESLGCGGHLSHLIRTRMGRFKLAESLSLERLKEEFQKNTRLEGILVPIENLLQNFPRLVVKPGAIRLVLNGNPLAITDLQDYPHSFEGGEWVAVHSIQGNLLALGQAGISHKVAPRGDRLPIFRIVRLLTPRPQ